MAELKEPAHTSLWPNYGSPVQPVSTRYNHNLDSGLAGHTTNPPHPPRARSNHPSMDNSAYPYSRYPQDESDPYDRHQHPGLASHQSYPSLKRAFSHTEQPPYQEIVQDLRDDGSKLTVNHDHKLLSFKKVQDKHTVVDQHGRMQQMELSAQLHGMFFLSEMPSGATEGSVLQPELTCYRRNLFQISGSLITARGPLSVVTETGETVPVSTTEVTVSAIESVDGHPVRLIVIPWKTPPPNSPEVAQGPDQEPPSLPLIPFQDEGPDADGEYAVYPIGWRRLQFRIATANNGRRKELQQHFVLHLKVVGTLTNGNKVVLTEATTSPIVVRGRSPRNFQARKEIPLLGSSAGSRGQALVETGQGIVAGPLSAKPIDVKARGIDMQMPRAAFTFNGGGPKMPGNQMGTMRSNSYPNWTSPGHVSMSHIPVTGAGSYSASPLTAETVAPGQQQTQARASFSYGHSTTAPPPLSIPTSADAALNIPRYVDSNHRPTKSPRHASHQSVQSGSSIANTDPSAEYRYSSSYVPLHGGNAGELPAPGYGADSTSIPHSAPPRDYYPPSTTWTTTAGEANATVAYTSSDNRSYSSPGQYKSNAPAVPVKNEQGAPPPGSGAVYNGPPRGSFDAMNHYSWHAI
ncbi:hypothetical protein VD0002_g7811 [Verticillium dahliae]|uniref:NDT80 domain-containing protein n=2 Tax=Verticillium dahliae TaxID=27337 RepID=A0AA44WTG3_VERDA|nr:Protein transport protein sec22 [Verticillium dahliae VDG2]KAF3359329.1 hypothetical protein VdG1_02352 [Verticillium dahliae VDG1]PNH35572.1 hypothetical protein BJF96_g1466 [Verticillium dahliae]PNH44683.1 hypothetical protein VD0004_g3079 [Verticillium dahliae]PNH56242.1 hypothetical protein VD0003_g1501 [Verticillium dahliae]